jgi:SAM-dependent methyltransferase
VSDVLRPGAREALEEWARRVRANRDQVEQFREQEAGSDFYAPVAPAFRADPRRTGEQALDLLLELVQPGETWLDIGAGGGRYALPLALQAGKVVAVEPSDGMLAVLRESIVEHGVANIEVVQARWPMPEAPAADVALIAHVGYDVEEMGPFLDAMEASARRLCVAVLLAEAPAAVASPFWPPVHGVERVPLPALREFLVLQLARGRLCEVRLGERQPGSYAAPDEALGFLRQQLWVQPASAKDRKLQDAIASLMHEREGRYAVSWEPTPLGVVSWAPPGRD